MPEEPPIEEFKYWAFICYSHTDEKWGQWLHRSLETFRVPNHLVGKKSRGGIIPKRLFPVFRDRDELPGSANLGEEIEAALQQSRFLVVICSPRAVASKWVDQEVRIFKSLGREHRVLCLVVEGEPHASTRHDCHEPECLPDAVRFWVHSDRTITPIPTEPIAADARKGKDGKKNALLKVLAGVLGVDYDALRQREEERKQRQQKIILTASAALMILFSILGAEFYFQKNDAVIAREAAENERDAANRAREAATLAQKLEEVARTNAVAAAEDAKRSANEAVAAQKRAEDQEKKATAAALSALKANAEKDAALIKEGEERKRAEAKEKEVRLTLALSLLASAARFSEEGNESKALAYLSRALRYDPENVAVTSRIISILSQKSWALPICAPLQHDTSVQGAAYSPDGKYILTRAGNSAVVWDAATGRHVYSVQHLAPINAIEFSPDGNSFVTASQDNTAQLWETVSGKKFGAPFQHQHHVLHATFSLDGKLLATASQDRTARVWEIATGSAITLPLEHEGPVKLVRFTPNGKSVVTAASAARRWEIATGHKIGISMMHESAVRALAVSPDGRWIATGAKDGARVWDAITGEPVTVALPHGDWINTLQFSPDSRQLLTASDDMTAKLWDISEERSISFKHELAVSSARFSPNGRWIVTASSDGAARIWKTSGELFCEDLRHPIHVSDACFSPDGKFLVTASADATARIWSVSSSRAALEPLRHEGRVNTACFSPDGRLLATVSDDRTARIWDVKTAQPVSAPLKHKGPRDPGYIVTASFSPDGKLLATGAEDGTAQLWDVATGKPLFEPLLHESWVNHLGFSPNSQWLVTASEDRYVRVWNTSTGALAYEPLTHDREVKKAVFSVDGKWIVTTAMARNLRIWDAATGKPASTNFVHEGNVTSADLSPDGKLLATGSEDKHVRIWNVATGERFPDLPHDTRIGIVSFTPAIAWADKPWLLTVSEKIARVWDVNKRKAVTEPLKNDDEIRSATFGPHGNLLATAAGKSVRVWEASTGRPVAEPLEFDKEVRSVIFSPDGNFIATTSADHSARIWLVSLHGAAPAWFADMIDAVASYKLGDFGAAELFSEQWNNFVSIQRALAAAPPDDMYATWARWFLSDRMRRNVSPFSSTSVAEYVGKAAKTGGVKALDDVLDLQPDNGLALVKMARLADKPAQAEFLSRLGESYEPKNADVLWVRAQVLQSLNKFNDAFAVMQRAIALDPKNVVGFGPDGTDISSTDWLPKGWSDNSPATVQAGYLKLPDLPQPGMTGIQIAIEGNRGVAELRGPHVLCRRFGKIIVEGWARSAVKDDFSISLTQFIEPFEKYKEQVIQTTTEWKAFKISFSPLQDIAVELRLLVNSRSTGSTVQVSGIACRVE